MITRLDNTGIVVADLPRVRDFFLALGMTLDGETSVEGEWVDRVLGRSGVRSDIAVLVTPDGVGRIELVAYTSPSAIDPGPVALETLGLRRLCFAVDDLDATLAVAQEQGAELLGEVVDYAGVYRLCYLSGPEGLVVMLAQALA